VDPLNNSNKIAWEKRSKLFGTSLKGVLFKGVPDVVNEHVHDWHKKVILHSIGGRGELRILDVGCGYGRLSLPIINEFSNLDIIELGTFDFIICVTVLMYLDHDPLNQAISNLLFHLKRDGKLILIEPHFSGHYFQTWFGLLTFFMKRVQKDTVDTQGRYFRSREIEQRFKHAGGQVLLEWRLPITSLFFGPLTFAGKLLPHGVVKSFCKFISLLDALLGKFELPSIQVAYLIARNEKG
jgi:2-polyprenyl-3-methyl-5-hydroxy-6-metoxy-1,4-benzoquinol methylase